ncbi:unnamed protein product [Rhizophagus irregularis]|uniref:Uncharacterized protein n=1 Tax=Rhizophagus irregularis TaxID=588596 RepID=A0A2I1H7J2_9GLOM|nr:hypothetical protein RhiirA4_473867 [Rhizophagus irregularis]CAB4433431.1 unnamed protein product [Rhizophagus irregularis]
MDIIGNLIKNDEEIVVLITYIVYVNTTNNFSSFDKKNTITTLPWLNPSNTTNEDPLYDINNDFLNFVNNHIQNKVNKVDKTDDIIKVSDDDNSKGRRKNNKKTNGYTTDVDKPSKRTRRKISDLATEFLQDKSDID